MKYRDGPNITYFNSMIQTLNNHLVSKELA